MISKLFSLVKTEFNKPCVMILVFLQVTVCLCLYELYNYHLIFVNIEPFEYTVNKHRHFHIHRKLYLDWGHLDYLSPQNSYVAWHKVKHRDPPPLESQHDKWIVITTSTGPTEAVKALAAVEGWKVVVVGNTHTPPDWSHDNCIFLDTESQKSLGFEISKLLPVDHYSRKNIGYLYAIQHGAKFIYDTDDTIVLQTQHANLSFHLDPSASLMMYDTAALTVNPCAHFGQKTLWLRGLPLESVREDQPNKLVQCRSTLPLVQQALVNGFTDVDAIFGLTRKEVNSDIKYDSSSKHVILPNGTFAPSNSQSTLFHYNAVWGMLLPVSTSRSVGDIWRGYITQRLLWQFGGSLAFLPPNSFKQRTTRNLSQHLRDEKPLYYDSLDLITFLKKWQTAKTNIFDQALDLSIQLAKKKLLDVRDAHLVEAWLHDLVSVGYIAPNSTVGKKNC